MKVVAIDELGGVDSFSEKELPLPKPGRNEVRIKIKAVGFNPVDCAMRAGFYGGNPSFPLVLGVECSGIIDAVGDKNHPFSVGDEVWAFVFGRSSNGTYAEYTCVPIQFVAKKPKNLSFEEAAAIPLTYLTAFQALIARNILQQNRPLFIAGGSGGVGTAAMALIHCYKGGPIFTTAGSEQSENYLIHTFHLRKQQVLRYKNLTLDQMKDTLIEMNKKERFYLCFDCVGRGMKELCLSVIDFYGHFASVVPEKEDFHIPIWGREKNIFFQKSLSFHFTFLGTAAFHGDEVSWNVYKTQLKHLTQLFEKENLMKPPIENMGPLSLQTVVKAHHRLEERHAMGKLIMTVSDSK